MAAFLRKNILKLNENKGFQTIPINNGNKLKINLFNLKQIWMTNRNKDYNKECRSFSLFLYVFNEY